MSGQDILALHTRALRAMAHRSPENAARLTLELEDALDALMAERDSLRQRGDDYAVEGIRVLERAERAEAERDELRYDLTVLREAWNKHFLSCPSGLSEIVPPTAEQVREWLNTPSDTASGPAGEAG